MNEHLYQYAVLLRPTPDEARKGEKTRIVVAPTGWQLFPSERAVLLQASRQIPEDLAVNKADQLDILVRPF